MLATRPLVASGTILAVFLAAACGGSKATTSSSGGSGTAGPSTSVGTGGSTSVGTGGSTTVGTGGGSTTVGTGGSTTTTSTSSSSSGSTSGGLFQAVEPWNTPCDQDPVDPASDTIINWLESAGGWGNGNEMQIDTSINILYTTPTTPMTPFTLSMGSCSPDCDDVTTFPVPVGGAVEGETGYACDGGGDCHLLVVDQPNNKLYEMWEAFDPPDANVFNSGGGAFIWDLTKAYPPNLRGDGCTSADAGGFPIAAMLFTADEVAAGHIDHAIRFILPNARIRDGGDYVHPATHTGVLSASTTRPDAPPYGVHFRLKSTFDLTQLPSPGAVTIAKAMQTYGMYLADGGNIALTAANDQFTVAQWTDADVNVDSHAMYALKVTDFEVVDLGTVITTGDNCIRNP
jgi:hypothetical protein